MIKQLSATLLLAVLFAALFLSDNEHPLLGSSNTNGPRNLRIEASSSLVIDPKSVFMKQVHRATLTEEQIKLQDSLVCNAIQNNHDERNATTIFMGTEPTKPYEGCFISSIFGLSPTLADKPLDVNSDLQSKYPDYGFLMFTNLVDLDAPGWQTFLHFDPMKKRMITQSRYPKFMAWQEEFVQRYCPVVFYLDGARQPKEAVEAFEMEKRHVLGSKEGFVQARHTPLKQELDNIIEKGKDTRAHMHDTLAWMQEQTDFDEWKEPKHIYNNCHIAYNPKSATFQEATTYFWDVYSAERLSWRDQPLWGYTLHHFNLKPENFVKRLFGGDASRVGGRKGGHQYDGKAEEEVDLFVGTVCKKN